MNLWYSECIGTTYSLGTQALLANGITVVIVVYKLAVWQLQALKSTTQVALCTLEIYTLLVHKWPNSLL